MPIPPLLPCRVSDSATVVVVGDVDDDGDDVDVDVVVADC